MLINSPGISQSAIDPFSRMAAKLANPFIWMFLALDRDSSSP
nr:MAG TPA: hypothetical protein [Caudoviricetes sp.]